MVAHRNLAIDGSPADFWVTDRSEPTLQSRSDPPVFIPEADICWMKSACGLMLFGLRHYRPSLG
jgi:hypothetical protein